MFMTRFPSLINIKIYDRTATNLSQRCSGETMLTKSQSPYWATETLEQTSPSSSSSSDTSGFKQQHVQKEQTTRKPTLYVDKM